MLCGFKMEKWMYVLLINVLSDLSVSGLIKDKLNIAVIIPQDDSRMFSIKHIKPALSYTLEYIKNNSILPSIEIQTLFADSGCSSKDAPIAAFQFHMNNDVDVFLGPVCDYSLAPVARYSPYWNIPVISPGGFAHDFGANKTEPDSEYPALTRVGVTFNSLSITILEIIKHFQWKRIKIIYDGNSMEDIAPRFCFLGAAAFVAYCKKYNLDHDFYMYVPTVHKTEEVLKEKVGNKYSVVVMCTSLDSARELMISARKLNFDNGEYVFINVDLFSSKEQSERPWYRENDTHERNEEARKAFEILMTVRLREPTSREYVKFSQAVIQKTSQIYPEFTNLNHGFNSFIGIFHDAVLMYAQVLNESIVAGNTFHDNIKLSQSLWNRSFTGLSGQIYIDENGDRLIDYSLLDLNPKTGIFEVVANYIGREKRFVGVIGKTIHWGGGNQGPPKDRPTCGFDNALCPQEEAMPEYIIVMIVLGSLLVMVLMVGLLIYRNGRTCETST